MTRCYYRILGLSFRATANEIKRSFRLLAFRFHPDRNPRDPEAVERFRQALEAYETLVDPNRRRKYDRRRGFLKSKARTAATGLDDDEKGSERSSTRDIFEEYFGVRVSQRQAFGGSPDLRFDLQVARSAVEVESIHQVEYVREVYCGVCQGRGVLKGQTVCVSCVGTGRTQEQMAVFVTVPSACRDGARVRVTGAGDRISRGLKPGDLVVYVQVIEGL
jgi:molecular chaperone DnaJ